ncbi:MAG: dihydropteroate synthase, partial [Deltaproteobacteria bacterium]|nr:dihydropteroate synthase [Deltaproteobacteria bacterium]
GADYLDVNAGTHPEQEPEDMAWLVKIIEAVTQTRLCLDSTNPKALLSGIGSATRLPMINSVSGERDRIERVLPIACEHGTDLVLLALDDKGIPKTTDERMAIVARLVSLAREGGLKDEQLFVDPLVTTIATQTDSGRIAFETIGEVKKQFPKVHITCGLSNISFGQPSRTLINQAFAALALQAGLDSAIMDPGDRGLRNMIFSAELVLGQDPDCLRYNGAHRSGIIGASKKVPETHAQAVSDAFQGLENALSSAGILSRDLESPSPSDVASAADAESAEPSGDHHALEELVTSLVEMKRDRVNELTENLLTKGTDPLEILDASKRAMAKVGHLFETEEYFIPELILAGRMLKSIADQLKPHIKGEIKGEKKGRVLLGTVAGDIHDIGKDIVVTMLEVNGYEVMDLGVDVTVERFVEAVKTFKPKVVGLSGFLTLVYEAMKDTVAAVRKESETRIQIMIGGGQIDEQVKSYTGADGYGKDAMDAVKLCRHWLEQN